MDLKQLLFRLSEASCISSRGPASSIALEEIRRFSPAARRDALGSIIAPIKADSESNIHILLDAHLDEIGFVVTNIDENGFLRVAKVGGSDLRVLLGHEVTVFTQSGPLFGVFCCKPPHLSSRDDYKKVPPIDELAVDIGFDAEEARKLVLPGDYITLRQSPAELCGGMITGKALDNRAGVAAVLRCLELCEEKLPCNVTALLSLSEECGERGATAASFSIAPTHAIAVDVSYGFTPGAPREKCGDIGGGPMIGVSPTLSREVTQQLIDCGKSEGITCQTEVMGGETGTNADVISISRAGVATGLVSIPLRYMHTAVELIDIADVESTARLMSAAIMAIGGSRA